MRMLLPLLSLLCPLLWVINSVASYSLQITPQSSPSSCRLNNPSTKLTATKGDLDLDHKAGCDRRGWISWAGQHTIVSLGLAGWSWSSTGISPALAKVAGVLPLTTFDDVRHSFAIQVPSDWIYSEQKLFDRRRLLLWTDPTDPRTALFIAYTPVRDDFTSLGSFGSVDQVAAQTIMPKGDMAGQQVQAEMLSAVRQKQAYFFDYTQAVPDLQQPATHFRTIFTLQPGATGGAGSVLVTITAQTPTERYPLLQPTLDAMMDSYRPQSSSGAGPSD